MKDCLFDYTQQEIKLIRDYRRLALTLDEIYIEQELFDFYDLDSHNFIMKHVNKVIDQFMVLRKIDTRSEAIDLLKKLAGLEE